MARLFRAVAALVVLTCLFGTTRASADDKRWEFPQQYSISPKGVNLQTGRFMSKNVDLSIGGLTFTRSWGDVPTYSIIGRSIGALNRYSATIPNGWTPTNIGWTHQYNQGVAYSPTSAGAPERLSVVVEGQLYSFMISTNNVVVPMDQSSQGTNLTSVSNEWVFTDKSGAIYTFYAHAAIDQGGTGNLNQVIKNTVYPDGRRLDYAYTSTGQLKFVSSNTGYAIRLEYDFYGNVSVACGFNTALTYTDENTACSTAPVKVSYGYSSDGMRLTAVTNPLGGVVTISYTVPVPGFFFPTCISQTNSSTCDIQNVYGPQGSETWGTLRDQVRKQTTATGAIWTYYYEPQAEPADVPVVMGQMRLSLAFMQEPMGGGYQLDYDRGRLVRQFTPSGVVGYRYAYRIIDAGTSYAKQFHDNLPGMVISPEGNREFFAHDARGNVTQHAFWPKGSGNPMAPSDPNWSDCCISPGVPAYHPTGSSVYYRTFPANWFAVGVSNNTYVMGCGSGPPDAKLCNKPLTVSDARGNITDYTYAVAHGGVLTETGPAVNGVRPQARYTYIQRYAGLAASGGGSVAATSPVWLLATKSICRTSAATGTGCSAASDEVVTTYEYGPTTGANNLLLRGEAVTADGQTIRTCYGYDWQGNRISETKPRAALTVCP